MKWFEWCNLGDPGNFVWNEVICMEGVIWENC